MIDFLYRFLSKRKLSTLHNIATVFAIIAYYVTPSRRKVVEKNCKTIGISPDKKLIKKIYINIFKSFLEFFYVENIDENFIVNNVVCENYNDIVKFYNKNKSLFVLAGHIGAWEMASPILSKYFKSNAAIIGRRIKNHKLNDLIAKVRSSHGNIYLLHKNALKEMMKYLNQDVPVAVLLDHSATAKSAIFVDFFGQKTSFIAGAVTVAVKKNVPFKPVFIIRNGLQYKIIDYPAIYPNKKLPTKERIEKMALDINKVYEDIISKYPEQWFMLHKRFKRTLDENGKIKNSFY